MEFSVMRRKSFWIFVRVLCHRPELVFLDMNLVVLKFAEALRKLPNSMVNVAISEPAQAVELYASVFFFSEILIYVWRYGFQLSISRYSQKLQEHFAHELHLYEKLKGQRSMMVMTEERYEQLNNKVIEFSLCKTDDIVLAKWSYVEAYIILSVFREYYDRLRYVFFDSHYVHPAIIAYFSFSSEEQIMQPCQFGSGKYIIYTIIIQSN